MKLKYISLILIFLVYFFNYIILPWSFYKIKEPKPEKIKEIIAMVVTEKMDLKSNFLFANGDISVDYNRSPKSFIMLYGTVVLLVIVASFVFKSLKPWFKKYPTKNRITKFLIFNFSPVENAIKLNKKQCRNYILIYGILNVVVYPLLLFGKILIIKTYYKIKGFNEQKI